MTPQIRRIQFKRDAFRTKNSHIMEAYCKLHNRIAPVLGTKLLLILHLSLSSTSLSSFSDPCQSKHPFQHACSVEKKGAGGYWEGQIKVPIDNDVWSYDSFFPPSLIIVPPWPCWGHYQPMPLHSPLACSLPPFWAWCFCGCPASAFLCREEGVEGFSLHSNHRTPSKAPYFTWPAGISLTSPIVPYVTGSGD